MGDARGSQVGDVTGSVGPSNSSESGRNTGSAESGAENGKLPNLPGPGKRGRSPHKIGLRKRYNSRKAAYEAAKKAGDGNPPIDHNGKLAHPKHGPHFHPADACGKHKS